MEAYICIDLNDARDNDEGSIVRCEIDQQGSIVKKTRWLLLDAAMVMHHRIVAKKKKSAKKCMWGGRVYRTCSTASLVKYPDC